MSVRVCVVESQLTGKEFSFTFETDEEQQERLIECVKLDGHEPEDLDGNYNYMVGPAPHADGVVAHDD